MEELARLPALVMPPAATPIEGGPVGLSRGTSGGVPGRRPRSRRNPLWSILGDRLIMPLVLLAAAIWGVIAWNERPSAVRPAAAERLASRPVSIAADRTAP